MLTIIRLCTEKLGQNPTNHKALYMRANTLAKLQDYVAVPLTYAIISRQCATSPCSYNKTPTMQTITTCEEHYMSVWIAYSTNTINKSRLKVQ